MPGQLFRVISILFVAFSSLPLLAQTLRRPLPACHTLPLSVDPKTGCFDDVDRDGEFQYARGDRAFDARGWVQYRWNIR